MSAAFCLSAHSLSKNLSMQHKWIEMYCCWKVISCTKEYCVSRAERDMFARSRERHKQADGLSDSAWLETGPDCLAPCISSITDYFQRCTPFSPQKKRIQSFLAFGSSLKKPLFGFHKGTLSWLWWGLS